MTSTENEFKFSTEWPLDGLLAYSQIQQRQQTSKSLVIQYLDPLEMGFRIQYHGSKYKVNILNDQQYHLSKYIKKKSVQQQNKAVSSPMPGRIVSIAVQEGDQVVEGTELVVVEAMKMQNILRTPQTGKIKKVHVEPGNTVKTGQVLIEFCAPTLESDPQDSTTTTNVRI